MKIKTLLKRLVDDEILIKKEGILIRDNTWGTNHILRYDFTNNQYFTHHEGIDLSDWIIDHVKFHHGYCTITAKSKITA